MNVAFDGRVISDGKSGVGVYVECLIRAISKAGLPGRHVIITNNGLGLPGRNFKPLVTGFGLEDHPAGDVWEQIALPRLLKKESIDVFHSPTFHLPFIAKGFKKVVSIYDMVSFRHPETQTKRFALYCRFMTRRACSAADAVIVPSEFIKKEIVSILGADPSVLHVVNGACRDIFGPPTDKDAKADVRKKYAIDAPFILCVGSIEPRKNLTTLIKAYSRLRKSGLVKHKLVVAGAKGWLNAYKRAEASVKTAGLADDVIFTGYVSDAELVALYTAASLFVYPSLYEGFGLPILEAFACGCPVISSDTSSIPEVAGKAALLVDPLNAEALARAMASVINDPSLSDKLVHAGRKRVKEFSWDTAARQTVKIYKSIARKR